MLRTMIARLPKGSAKAAIAACGIVVLSGCSPNFTTNIVPRDGADPSIPPLATSGGGFDQSSSLLSSPTFGGSGAGFGAPLSTQSYSAPRHENLPGPQYAVIFSGVGNTAAGVSDFASGQCGFFSRNPRPIGPIQPRADGLLSQRWSCR